MAVGLAPVHRQHAFGGALIAQHQIELRAQHLVHHARIDGHGGACARGGEAHGGLHGLVSRPYGIGAHEDHIHQRIDPPDPSEFRGLHLGLDDAQALVQRQGGGDDADGQAILRRARIKKGRRRHAASARHVAGHDGGIARDMAGHVGGEHPRIGVIAASGGKSDHDVDRLATIEVFGLGEGLRAEQPRRASPHQPQGAAPCGGVQGCGRHKAFLTDDRHAFPQKAQAPGSWHPATSPQAQGDARQSPQAIKRLQRGGRSSRSCAIRPETGRYLRT